MTVKTVILTSGSTWTVPSDFSSLVSVEAIGGGVCGSPGFQGAVDLESLSRPQNTGGTFSSGFGGDGGHYCKATTATTPLAVGQVLNFHIATSSPPVGNLTTWENSYFNGTPPDCLSDDTWIKDSGGHYIVFAPGGDSSSSVVGSIRITGGTANDTPTQIVTSAAGGGAGGPAGVPDGQTGNGAAPGFINPTQIKLFGSGGGSGNLTNSVGNGTVGSRTAAGAGAGSGGSDGGAGGNITGNVTVSSSLLLPSLTNPAASDAVTTNAGFLFGGGDFTIDIWYQAIFQNSALRGALLSVWDIHNNQRSWMVTMGTSAYADDGWPVLTYSTNGTDVVPLVSGGGFPLVLNPVLKSTYLSGGIYYGPPSSGLGWAHIAICRASNVFRIFVDGYPSQLNDGSTYTWVVTDANAFFASSANLTVGATLNNGVINTASGPGANETPLPGWYGNMRVTIGSALYTCPATSVSPLGQQFTPPAAPLGGGQFLCNWPGAKGATSSTAGGATLTFVGSAQIDSDQYCYTPPVPEIGGAGLAGATGNLWTDGNLTVGPGGGGGGGGGDLSRYRMITGGAGGDGGLYGGGGGQGGGVNSGVYVGLGNVSASPGLGGQGAPGLIVIQYNATVVVAAQREYFRLVGV